MADLVSGWTEDDQTFLVQREGDETKVRAVPARWSLFATSLDDSDRATIARDRRVTGIKTEGRYTRIDCRNRWARRDVCDLLEKAARDVEGFHLLEADVSPLRRILSDVPSLQVHESPRLAYLDLETDSRASFTAMKAGEARILSWAVCDAEARDVGFSVLEADTDAAERHLLRELYEVLEGFDVVLAWNGDGFDFPVLKSRAEELKETPRLPWHRWTWLDHLEVFKKYNMHSDGGGEQKASFKLDHVATYLLGEGKHDFDASRTWEAWEAGGEERRRLVRYNVQDTALLPRIEAKTGFLALHLAVCSICRVFPDTESLNATQQGDGFLLALGAERGWRWATKNHYDDGGIPDKFKGAYVMEPTRLGAVDRVHVADFAGLYPSIMRTWNMSPDTKIGGSLREGMARLWHEKKAPVVGSKTCQLPNRATWFRTDRDGMFRIALDTLVAKRAEYQAAMKLETPGTPEHERAKRLQGAFKIVANSFYGITGSPWSRFFDPEIAEGVTQTGRWLLENVIEESKLAGLDPFYGDTDSVFVSGDGDVFRERVVRKLNGEWGARLAPWGIRDRHHVDLDFEKTFKRVIIVSAKRYAGSFLMYKGKAATADAKPEVKGLEFKRGDTIRLAREMQAEVVGRLLQDGPLPDAAAIREIVDRWRHRVLEERLDLADLTITQSLSKPLAEYADRFTVTHCTTKACSHNFGETDPKKSPDTCPECNAPRARTSVPAHVRVARLLQERGTPLGEGDRVAYVVVGTDGNKMEAIPASDPDALERADLVYYWERRIYAATARVLEHVYPGRSWGESRIERKDRVLEAAGQTRLDFAPQPRIRRRRVKAPPKVVVTIMEGSPAEDGGCEAHRRRVMLEALRAAIEAHPGEVPVDVEIKWSEPLGRETVRTKVVLHTGLSIATTTAARRALERVATPDFVSGF